VARTDFKKLRQLEPKSIDLHPSQAATPTISAGDFGGLKWEILPPNVASKEWNMAFADFKVSIRVCPQNVRP